MKVGIIEFPQAENVKLFNPKRHTQARNRFLRAEVIGSDDLCAAGTWDGAKSGGKLRLEGKEYPVKDGDIIHIRFTV